MTVLLANDAGAAIGSALLLLIILALAALWVWTLVDAIRVPNDGDYRAGTKLIWVLVIVLTGFVGAAVYLAVGRPAGDQPPIASRHLPPWR
jgi:hypothetical protein